MPGIPRSAKNAQIRLGATALFKSSWDVTPKTDRLDYTNFESAGFGFVTSGIIWCEFSFEGFFDAGQNEYDSPPGLQIGVTIVSGLKLYINTTGGPFWSFPTFVVFESAVGAKVHELVSFKCSGESSGVFVYPTGAA